MAVPMPVDAPAGRDSGFTLAESMVAMGLILVILAASVSFGARAIRFTSLGDRHQQAAVLAADAMEKLRATAPAELVTGRDATSVQSQWNSAPAPVSTLLAGLEPLSDPLAVHPAGATATVPTAPTTSGVFTSRTYLGICWLLSTTTPGAATVGNCATANKTAADALGMYKAVTAVGWSDTDCTGGVCWYVTSVLLDDNDAEPVFDNSRAPDAPYGVVATAGDAQIAVGWTAPADNGRPITGYTVTAVPANGAIPARTCIPAGTSIACTLTGLTNGVTYSITVTATNANGTGPASTPVTATPLPSSYVGMVKLDDPQFYLRLDDAGGSPALNDASAFNRPGVNPVPDGSGATAGRYRVAGAPIGDGDTAAHFDGNGSYVVRNGGDPTPTSDYSIELWFRSSSAGGGLLAAQVCGSLPGANNWSRMAYVDSGGRLTYGDWTGATGAVQSVRSGARVDDGAWHHIVGVHAGTTLSLYLDGVSQGSISSPPQTYDCPWVLGGANVGWYGWHDVPVRNFFDGDIDEFAYYTYGLSDARATAHFTSRTGTAYRNAVQADTPQLYWRLNDAPLSTRAADATTNKNTGHYYLDNTVVGAATGALVTSPNNATWFSGRASNAYQPTAFTNPQTLTAVTWFRTVSVRGGVLLGFTDPATGAPASYDRHLYLLNDGRVAWGVWNGAANVLYSPAALNDGQWHMAVGSVGPAGLKLYIDGALVGHDPGITTAQIYTGYWRLGGAALGGWPSSPVTAYYTGHLDEVAVYSTQLSDTRIAQQYARR